MVPPSVTSVNITVTTLGTPTYTTSRSMTLSDGNTYNSGYSGDGIFFGPCSGCRPVNTYNDIIYQSITVSAHYEFQMEPPYGMVLVPGVYDIYIAFYDRICVWMGGADTNCQIQGWLGGSSFTVDAYTCTSFTLNDGQGHQIDVVCS